ncbi:GTPase [Tautonia plasticadhaerens]|uniref:tRNA modification GTPase MnmE n=1 Tax=Tautonia plasticadhaerens TaxID=2527974 RepID=A0A518H9G9_9BACT|nr:GTPase [Tautonia plasticadhaerens]QDV37493.1 tRNA modification GTPase MnmE [Tautonia plasticadhaerens]
MERMSTGRVPSGRGPFFSLLTAESRGAIAVIRIWGDGAVAVADAAFRPNRGPSLAASPTGRPRVGRVGEGTGDEVVAVVVDGHDGHPEAEIQCHGGPAAVSLAVEAVVVAGAARRASESWLTRRAPTTIRAQAEYELGFAETGRSAMILLDQALGAFDDELDRLASRVISEPSRTADDLDVLIRRVGLGTRLVTGWRVALAGRPNVGKSRLLNALSGYGRAIVSPTPGTTRDVVTARTAIDGWPVELADTAGLRSTDDPIERGGVSLARARHVEADLVLLVLDLSEPLTEVDRALIAEHPSAILACNKADLTASWGPEAEWGASQIVSAERGEGLDDLLGRIARRLVPDPPPEGAAVPFRVGHARSLGRALGLLRGGRPEAAMRALLRLRGRGG